jgi:putative ABC transport system permease protein
MVVFEGMRPTLIGLVIGAGGALALGRLLSGLIYGVTATDPVTFLAVIALLALIALFASIVPAYRATKVDPMTALRYE